jgi:hypothetical protein
LQRDATARFTVSAEARRAAFVSARQLAVRDGAGLNGFIIRALA